MIKVDETSRVLMEGQTYLVPIIEGSLSGKWPTKSFPVIGPRHYDVEFFNVHAPHYHLDLRFINFTDWYRSDKGTTVLVGRKADGSLPSVHYEPMKCLQSQVVIYDVRSESGPPDAYKQLVTHFEGRKCEGSKQEGWTCPHKGTFLGDTNGVITCPAHGLKIDNRTGKVLGLNSKPTRKPNKVRRALGALWNWL